MAFLRNNDPFSTLGLPSTAGRADIDAARRRLAKVAHPDAGGSDEEMQRVNDAADQAVASLASRPASGIIPRTERVSKPQRDERPRSVRTDNPSFTIEALPPEAFEGLLIAATALGTIIDDEPPYALDVSMEQPNQCWCRLQVSREAGSSTVSLVVAAAADHLMPSMDAVRDAWIDELNELDWSRLGQPQPPS
jgi:hypothetical protein